MRTNGTVASAHSVAKSEIQSINGTVASARNAKSLETKGTVGLKLGLKIPGCAIGADVKVVKCSLN